MNSDLTLGMFCSNQPCICLRKMSESSKRQSTRATRLPSSVLMRGAMGLAVTLGGKPVGLRTVRLVILGASYMTFGLCQLGRRWRDDGAPSGGAVEAAEVVEADLEDVSQEGREVLAEVVSGVGAVLGGDGHLDDDGVV